MSSAAKLGTLRKLASSEVRPLEEVLEGRLAISPARLAKLVEVSQRTIEKELEDGNIPTTWIRGSRRISTLDVAEYLERHRTHGPRSQRDAAAIVDSWLHG